LTAAPPLTGGEFAAALEALADIEAAPFLAVAVSGGSDSLALALLSDRWARERGGGICALTVDHRLRPESADEIRRLQGWLTTRYIRHEVLVWSDPKPATGIEAAARQARYRLLAEWCRERGCLHLLTAHHADDQSETYLIRRRARSGPDGLAGMSAVRELAACRVLRPLLGFAKARLTAMLVAEGQAWITDPSNLDPAFERARLRLAGAGAASADIAELGALGRRRQSRERARDGLLARAVMLHPAGFAGLDLEPWRRVPPDIVERALAALAATIGGGSYAPRRQRLVRLRRALFDSEPRPSGHTLGGCRFVAWRDRILVLREAAAAAGPVSLTPGAARFWDRRFRISLAIDAPDDVVVGYLGRSGVAELYGHAPELRRSSLPRLLYPVLPAVWDRAGLAAVPALGYRRNRAGPLPQMLLRPVHCLAAEPFAVVSRPPRLMSRTGTKMVAGGSRTG
jgi:tRNA(Ile)-lysidine synthase